MDINKLKEEEKVPSYALLSHLNIDNKHILNLSTETVPETVLEQIENEGITIEHLEQLDLPICKYNTQITIHGRFPDLLFNRIGYYKNIFQNKNQSIGIKYNAVDYVKKKRIQQYVKNGSWCCESDSRDFYLYQYVCTTKEKAIKKYQEYKQMSDVIDKRLFCGSVHVDMYNSLMFGYVAVIKIFIKAVYETDVHKLIESLTNKTMEELDKIKEEQEKVREEERIATQIEYAKEQKELEKIQQKNEKKLIERFGEKILVDKPGRYIGASKHGDVFFLNEIIKIDKKRFLRYQTEKYDTIEKCLSHTFDFSCEYLNKIMKKPFRMHKIS